MKTKHIGALRDKYLSALIVGLLLMCSTVKGQIYTSIANYGYNWQGGYFARSLAIPSGSYTPSTYESGLWLIRVQGDRLMLWSPTLHAWVPGSTGTTLQDVATAGNITFTPLIFQSASAGGFFVKSFDASVQTNLDRDFLKFTNSSHYVKIVPQNTINGDYTITLPNATGTLPLSVNGQTADATGAISLTIPSPQGLSDVLGVNNDGGGQDIANVGNINTNSDANIGGSANISGDANVSGEVHASTIYSSGDINATGNISSDGDLTVGTNTSNGNINLHNGGNPATTVTISGSGSANINADIDHGGTVAMMSDLPTSLPTTSTLQDVTTNGNKTTTQIKLWDGTSTFVEIGRTGNPDGYIKFYNSTGNYGYYGYNGITYQQGTYTHSLGLNTLTNNYTTLLPMANLKTMAVSVNGNFANTSGDISITLPTVASTSSVLKGDGSGNAVAATPGTDYVKPTTATTYTAGAKQTFGASATTAGLSFGGVTANPSGATTGDMWYRTDLGKFGYNDGSTNRYLVTEQLAQVLKNKDLTDASNTFPTLNQNTTGTAANITGTTNSTLTALSSLSLPASQVTLSGLSTSTSTAVTSSDNGLVAIGKLQAEINTNTTNIGTKITLPSSPSTGDLLYYNGTTWINGTSTDRQHNEMNFFEDFQYPVSNRCSFDFSSSGTGAQSNSVAPIFSNGVTGVDGWAAPSPVALQTGTTTTGYAWVFQGLSGSGVWAPDYTAGKVVWEWLNVGVRVLSDGTNTYILLAGMNSNPTAAEPSTGTYFKYLSTESANWQVCSANGSGHTCVITTTAVAVQTKYNLRAEITTAGTLRAYINNTEVAASSGTYPMVSVNNIDASTRNQPSIILRKIAGTTNTVANYDAFSVTQYLTTPR